jgi:hypothetical protein
MQSSGDACESRLPPHTATAFPPPSVCARQRPNSPPQSQQPMRPKSRCPAPFLQAGCISGPNRTAFRPNQPMG